NANHRQAQAQADCIKQRQLQHPDEEALQAVVDAIKQQQSFFEERIRHTANQVFLKADAIIQQEVSQIRHQKQGRQPVNELNQNGAEILFRELPGNGIHI